MGKRALARAFKAANATTLPQPLAAAIESAEQRGYRIALGRYECGALVGWLRRCDLGAFREAHGLPRAALITIRGVNVIVADLTETMRTGWAEVVAVEK